MSRSKEIKLATQFAGLLLCIFLTQTAFAAGNIAGSGWMGNQSENTTIENTTVNSVSPSDYSTYLLAGGNTHFTATFTNVGNETRTLIPKVVAMPSSQNNLNESWVTISPANTTAVPGSIQNFDIGINAPRDAESGFYQGAIAFTDDLLPNSSQYVNSMQLGISVQAQSKIELQTSYLSDTLDAGKEYEYKIKIKNVAAKDITINPTLNTYNSGSEQGIGNDAIEISAPSVIKAGEVTNVTINVNVPNNSTGTYNGYIDMGVDGKLNDGSTPQIGLYFNVLKQFAVPYAKTFSTTTNVPITIEVSTNDYDSAVGLRTSPKDKNPSFNMVLTRNSIPVNLTLVKSAKSGSLNTGSSYPVWAMENGDFYQEYSSNYVETYTVPGAIGNWKLTILPKNTSNFGYLITVGNGNSTIQGNETVDNTTTGNITNGVIADFIVSPTSGNAPLSVKFTDKSTGSPTEWKWNFGDGSEIIDGNTSAYQNPTHVYSKAGTYTVKETAINAVGRNTVMKTNYITVK